MIAPLQHVAYRRRHGVNDVSARVMTVDGRPVLDTRAVAEILGVKPKTISQYLVESRPPGRYANHPFPAPHGRVGRSPYWLPEQEQAIREWDAGRAGQGVGGGRPRKKR